MDVVPTVLDAAGIDLPDHLDGVPLREAASDHVLIQVSESEVGRAYVHAPDAGDVPIADHYVERALYDLDADPHELDNLIDNAGHQEIASELREVLIGAVARIEHQRATVTPYPDVRYRGCFPETTVRRGQAGRPTAGVTTPLGLRVSLSCTAAGVPQVPSATRRGRRGSAATLL